MSKKKKLLLLVIVIIVSVFAIYKMFNNDKMNYIALGDSLAAGMNPYGEIGYGYTDFVADALKNKNKLKFYTKEYTETDSDTEDLIKQITNYSDIKKDLRESNLVTLSIGGNDIINSIGKEDIKLESIGNYKNMIKDVFKDIENCVKEVRKYAKNKLVIVGYYNPIPFLFNTSEKELDELFSYIDDEYQQIAKKYDAIYISNYQLFKKNSDLLPNPKNAYPNIAGYQQIAEKIISEINNKNK